MGDEKKWKREIEARDPHHNPKSLSTLLVTAVKEGKRKTSTALLAVACVHTAI